MDAELVLRLRDRVETLKAWLLRNAPYVETEQNHLNDGTSDRAYWHYGYLCALQDVLRSTGYEPKRITGGENG